MPTRRPLSFVPLNSVQTRKLRIAVESLEPRTLLSAGDPDLSFGTSGKALLPGSVGDTNYRVHVVAVQSDGKTLLAGSAGTIDNGNLGQFFLERLNADGMPDPAFGSGGIVTTTFSNLDGANAIAIQADGKIVLGGLDESTLSGTYDGDAQFALARYNTDGTPDASFGNGGKVLTRIPGREQIDALTIAPDGKILAAGLGTFQDPNHLADPNFAVPVFMVARYTVTGTLDSGFGGTGYIYRETDASVQNEAGAQTIAVAAQADGKVLIGSSFKQDSAVWRFNVDGSSDAGFGLAGMTWKPLQFYDLDDDYSSATVSQMLVQPDGKILVAGSYDRGGGLSDSWMVARFNVDGSVDSGFGSASQVDGPGISIAGNGSSGKLNQSPAGMGIEADGKIILGGMHGTGGIPTTLVRFLPDGTQDASYQPADITYSPGTAFDAALAVTSTGQVIVANDIQNPNQIGVTRLLGDSPAASTPATPAATTVNVSAGGLNPIFGNSGRTAINDDTGVALPDSIQNRFNAVTVQADGKTLVAGSTGTRDNQGKGSFLLERFNVDGSLDTTFGTAGKVTTAFGPISYATAILIQADGRIVVGGASEDSVASPTNVMFALARYAPDGSPDSTFGAGGKLTTDFTGNEQIDSLSLTPDGKIVAAGSSFAFPDIGFDAARYNTDGSLDASFNSTGELSHDLGKPLANSYPSSVAVQSDGKILVGSLSGGGAAVYRFNTDGTVDDLFGTHGVAAVAGGTDAAKIAIQSDGKIVVGLVDPPNGTNPDYKQSTLFGLARLTADGAPDNGFGSAGVVKIKGNRALRHDPSDLQPPYEPLGNLVIQGDGKIIVAATQDYVDGFSDMAMGSQILLRRFLADGTPDSSFQDSADPAFVPLPNVHGTTLTGAVLTPDGKLVIVADTWSNNSASTPHWSGVAEYLTAAAAVTVPPPTSSSGSPGSNPGSGNPGTGNPGTGNPGTGSSPGATPLPAGQLGVVFTGKLPASIVATGKGLISIRITNSAKTRFTGPVSVSLYASADGALSDDDVLITTLNIPALNLAAGKAKTIKLKFTYPVSLTTGTFDLLASVTETNQGTAPAVAASSKTVSIQAATVDIAAVFASGNTFTATLGRKSRAILNIKNSGTVAANGSVQITLFASTDQAVDGSDTTLSGPISKTIKIKPGKSMHVNMSFTMPGSAFNYLLGQVIPSTQIADASASNDVATAVLSV